MSPKSESCDSQDSQTNVCNSQVSAKAMGDLVNLMQVCRRSTAKAMVGTPTCPRECIYHVQLGHWHAPLSVLY